MCMPIKFGGSGSIYMYVYRGTLQICKLWSPYNFQYIYERLVGGIWMNILSSCECRKLRRLDIMIKWKKVRLNFKLDISY